MKRIIVSLGLALGSATAWADIPAPTVDQLQVAGAEATELANSLPGAYEEVGGGSPVSSYVIKRKVSRSSKGLTQIVCYRVEMRRDGALKNENCKIQKSGNGVPLDPAR